ncbi:lamina-associated polypeptide 2, isoforms beta/delta/epsilon/gamma-like [Salvelinus fontinalis]|uniref:lamina-associated polypeptide 2, isoforms beta/delta/epsilon/gamma-like n=1 Tax=Salvelinus fontinalis TaxID=8038 RepID=UPI002485B5E1|nr:lamina-associated polypeptide 2, isoforms beta/delta/epsilon/gamma-like [Salvelinus fontinalis]
MGEFLENPSVLTKDKLKSELTANNVPLPISEQKKRVYVQLYLKNLTVLNQKSPLTDMFSSDEELPTSIVSNKSLSGRKSTRKTDNPRSEEVEVTDLKDAGLNDELLKHGVNVGPIVSCTRILYEKKLQKLLDTPAAEATPSLSETATVTAAAVKAVCNQNGNTLSDQYSDKDEDEIAAAPEPEPAPVVEKPVMSRGKTPVTIRTSSRRSNKVVDEGLATGDQTPKKTGKNVEEILANEILSPIGISATCRRSIRGAAGRPVKPSNYWLNESLLGRSIDTESHSECSSLGSEPARPGFLSVLLKLMVLITVAGSIYFVIQHLDADQVQSVKGLINDAKGHLCSTVDKVVDAVVDNVIVPLGIRASSSQSAGAEGGGK